MSVKNVEHPYLIIRTLQPHVNKDGWLRHSRPYFNRSSQSIFLQRVKEDLQGPQTHLISLYLILNMNNPFLSDRNIFSKVVNPIKKREEVKKEDVKGSETGKIGEKYKESKVESYTGYKNEKGSEGPVQRGSVF